MNPVRPIGTRFTTEYYANSVRSDVEAFFTPRKRVTWEVVDYVMASDYENSPAYLHEEVKFVSEESILPPGIEVVVK